jgi:hypothetical protein
MHSLSPAQGLSIVSQLLDRAIGILKKFRLVSRSVPNNRDYCTGLRDIVARPVEVTFLMCQGVLGMGPEIGMAKAMLIGSDPVRSPQGI